MATTIDGNTLSAIASTWAVTKSLMMLDLDQQYLNDQFQPQIPLKKLPLQEMQHLLANILYTPRIVSCELCRTQREYIYMSITREKVVARPTLPWYVPLMAIA